MHIIIYKLINGLINFQDTQKNNTFKYDIQERFFIPEKCTTRVVTVSQHIKWQ